MNQKICTVLVTDENYNEKDYLASNPDVARAVKEYRMSSGKIHFEKFGRNEGRIMQITVEKHPQYYSWVIKFLRKIIPQSVKNKINMYVTEQNPTVDLAYDFAHLQAIQTRVNDIETLLQQLLSIIHHESNLPLPPPKHLQIRVAGNYAPYFIETGYGSFYPTLNRVLKPTGKELKNFHSILDFGCGCGRAIRALATMLPGCKLYGTDIDEEAIDWLNRHYSKFAKYSVAPHLPPTTFEDQKFDLVFGISVFTHLPEEMQFQWLKELSRITKPDGYLILTTHGEKHYKGLTADVLEIMNSKGFFYSDFGSNYGNSISLPDFYQTAFHSHAYIQREWGKYFDVIDIQALGLDNHQDTILLQNHKYKG